MLMTPLTVVTTSVSVACQQQKAKETISSDGYGCFSHGLQYGIGNCDGDAYGNASVMDEAKRVKVATRSLTTVAVAGRSTGFTSCKMNERQTEHARARERRKRFRQKGR